MNSENPDQTPTVSLSSKLADLIKEKSWAIIGSLLSSSIIAYLSSRFFIKFYLVEIGYPSLTYNALLDNSTVSALTFGIFTVLVGFLFAFCIAPAILRWLYIEQLDLYEELHQKYKNPISTFLFICLSLPLLILVPEKNIPLIEKKYFIYLIFTSSFLFVFFLFKTWKTTNVEQKFKLLFHGFLFGGVSFLAFLPFLILINALNYSNISNFFAYFVITAIVSSK